MPRALSLAWVGALSLLVGRPALAQEPADPRGTRGVLVDLERIVKAEESSGWFLDATHQASLYPVVLQTVCRATEEARHEALAEAARRSHQAGDPKTLFTEDGELTGRVEGALSLRRQHDLLRLVVEGAAKDCPFWVRPQAGFPGRQTYQERWFLSFESGGLLQLRRTLGDLTYGGGGVGRILGGYGLNRRFSLLFGGEFAGGAMLRSSQDRTSFVINYFPAIPLLLRVHSVAWHYDFEVAGVSLLQADNTSFSFGTRVGFALGVSALRTRFFIPWAGAAFAYEHYFEGGGRAPQDFIRLGLRVGAVWDP
jgi:hypothetical protein